MLFVHVHSPAIVVMIQSFLKVNAHSPRAHVQKSTDTSQAKAEPPQSVGVDVLHHVFALRLKLELPVEGHFCVEATLRVALASSGCGRSGKRVEGGCWKHLRRAVGEVHRVHGGAVEFVEVQARDVVVGVDDLLVSLQARAPSAWMFSCALLRFQRNLLRTPPTGCSVCTRRSCRCRARSATACHRPREASMSKFRPRSSPTCRAATA